jgi:hypothetical protein
MARLYGPGPENPPPLVSTGDLAGLRTTDVEDRPVGELFGALSEEQSGLIRYLDVELDGAAKHVLVPIGHTRIDHDSVHPRVRLRAATFEDLLDVPEYDPHETALDGTFQERLLQAYGRLFYGSYYYAHPAYDHSALYAGDSPVLIAEGGAADAGETPEAASVVELTRTGQGVSAQHDLRGLPVEDVTGEDVGTVTELLVDRNAGQPRYAVVDLAEPRRATALPLGYLSRNRDGDRARTVDLTVEDIRLLPAYEVPFTREAENRLLAALERRLSGARYFQRPDFRRR